jgi:hypothetical protein
MANGFIVSKESWDRMKEEDRKWITFDTMQNMNVRLKKLEGRPLADKCFSLAGGVIGGFAAALGLKFGG